jgi:ribosomal protein L37AE/L43A
MTQACSGPCNRAYRKALESYELAVREYRAALGHANVAALAGLPEQPRPEAPEPPKVEATAGDPVWCSRCARMITAALKALDDHAAKLAAKADGHRERGDDARSTHAAGPGSPSPIGDTLDELYGDLVLVEDQWREARGYLPRPYRGRGARARMAVIAWLSEHIRDILAHPGSVDFGLRVLMWERRLQALAKDEPQTKRRAGRCPRCDQRAIRRREDGYSECAQCGRLMHEDEYTELVEAEASGQESA